MAEIQYMRNDSAVMRRFLIGLRSEIKRHKNAGKIQMVSNGDWTKISSGVLDTIGYLWILQSLSRRCTGKLIVRQQGILVKCMHWDETKNFNGKEKKNF